MLFCSAACAIALTLLLVCLSVGRLVPFLLVFALALTSLFSINAVIKSSIMW